MQQSAVPEITAQEIGPQHQRVRRVLDLLRNTRPNPDRRFVAEELWACNALLDAGTEVETFFWCPQAAYSDEAQLRARQLAARATDTFRVSERTFARMSERDRPDGLLSIARLPRWDPDTLPLDRSSLVVVTDGMEIPGNLGTLLRSMDAAAADALLMVNRRTRLTHPKVFRASHGMVLTVPSLDFDSVGECADWLADRGFGVLLADSGAHANHTTVDYPERTALVLGAERFGLSREWAGRGTTVTLPMRGRADSLNVSVAASILLFTARERMPAVTVAGR